MGGIPVREVVLSGNERDTLERWARRHTSAQALALRCRIVLACAEGGNNTEVADPDHDSTTTGGHILIAVGTAAQLAERSPLRGPLGPGEDQRQAKLGAAFRARRARDEEGLTQCRFAVERQWWGLPTMGLG